MIILENGIGTGTRNVERFRVLKQMAWASWCRTGDDPPDGNVNGNKIMTKLYERYSWEREQIRGQLKENSGKHAGGEVV